MTPPDPSGSKSGRTQCDPSPQPPPLISLFYPSKPKQNPYARHHRHSSQLIHPPSTCQTALNPCPRRCNCNGMQPDLNSCKSYPSAANLRSRGIDHPLNDTGLSHFCRQYTKNCPQCPRCFRMFYPYGETLRLFPGKYAHPNHGRVSNWGRNWTDYTPKRV